MTATTKPRGNGDARWLTAEDHLLRIPAMTADEHAEERDLARRAIHRIAGDNASDILNILDLIDAEPTPELPPVPAGWKRCTGCQEPKPRSEYYKRIESRDGLYSQCKTCNNAARRNTYRNARRAARSGITPGGRNMSCAVAAVDERLDTYRRLIRRGRTPLEAAEEMSIGERTARRYLATLRKRGQL